MKEILTLIIFISNIFQVENDSVLVNMDTPKGYTRPTIVTDSRLLSSLITGKLVGKMDTTGGSFKIRIFVSEK